MYVHHTHISLYYYYGTGSIISSVPIRREFNIAGDPMASRGRPSEYKSWKKTHPVTLLLSRRAEYMTLHTNTTRCHERFERVAQRNSIRIFFIIIIIIIIIFDNLICIFEARFRLQTEYVYLWCAHRSGKNTNKLQVTKIHYIISSKIH